MRRCKLLTTGDVTHQYRDGVGSSLKGWRGPETARSPLNLPLALQICTTGDVTYWSVAQKTGPLSYNYNSTVRSSLNRSLAQHDSSPLKATIAVVWEIPLVVTSRLRACWLYAT